MYFERSYFERSLHFRRYDHELRGRHLAVDSLDEDTRANGVGHGFERGALFRPAHGSLLKRIPKYVSEHIDFTKLSGVTT